MDVFDPSTCTDPAVLEHMAKSLPPSAVGELTLIAENPATPWTTTKWILENLHWRALMQIAQYTQAPHLLKCLSTVPLRHRDVARNPHTPFTLWMCIKKHEIPGLQLSDSYFRDVCYLRVYP